MNLPDALATRLGNGPRGLILSGGRALRRHPSGKVKVIEMKLATLACLASLSLLLPLTAAAQTPTQGQAQPAQPQPSPSPTPQNPASQAKPAKPAKPGADKPQAEAAGQGAPHVGAGGGRRRTSYASCNRESHKRDLRGGARRRFLIRCRLGYERKQPQGQAPGRRP